MIISCWGHPYDLLVPFFFARPILELLTVQHKRRRNGISLQFHNPFSKRPLHFIPHILSSHLYANHRNVSIFRELFPLQKKFHFIFCANLQIVANKMRHPSCCVWISNLGDITWLKNALDLNKIQYKKIIWAAGRRKYRSASIDGPLLKIHVQIELCNRCSPIGGT